jgi:tetratricopeptide (TPR) repeat protein
VNGFSKDDMRAALPDKAQPRLMFAEYLSAIGDPLAADSYFNALDLAAKETKASAGWFLKANRYFTMNKREEDSMRVLQLAVKTLPDDVGLRIRLGQLYEKTGIIYRAKEEYQQALLIDPSNKTALKRMADLKDRI